MSKLRHIEWDERTSAAANARRHLSLLAADYFVAVRGLLAENPGPPELHKIRRASKRLRYSLELFRPYYGPGLELRLQALRRLQELSGEVNDAVVTQQLLAKQTKDNSPQRQQIQELLEERAASKALAFRKEWQEVFDARGQLQWWLGYLAHYGR